MPKLSDKRKPEWLKIKVPGDEGYRIIKHLLKNYDLHTVCEEAMCPNVEECWRQKTATFMILGNICTRNCRFCGIQKGIPLPPDLEEPTHLAEAVEALGLHYVVITSVDRDDLSDGGAVHWAESINKIRELCPDCRIEILIPDFKGDTSLLDTVLEAEPHVVGHNLET
ncbi:MAG: lipoyl synthase, partial [Candidatus Marinimicrobia bacterium]|nr:lipoyl synthase [Candidatus Neomarinimicrobiota bacterium]